MHIALLHEHYDPDHLESVIAEMRILGAPTIRAVWMECHMMWVALEGCHRLRAAHILGLVPLIDEIDYEADMPIDCAEDPDLTIAKVCDDAYRAVVLDFEPSL